MKISGIICEYNPFHNGHAHHIAETKKGCDGVVCVMSGDFVQRGDVAIISKHLRARAAVSCGADLVIELPTPYSCASAEHFAKAGVALLEALGVVDNLSFGAENADLPLLRKTARILNHNDFYDRVSEYLKSGVSFAVARERALHEISPECADIIAKPNNLLAVEYLRFLPDEMDGFAVARKEVDHDGDTCSNGFCSASLIRQHISSGRFEDVSAYLPLTAYEIFKNSAPVFLDDRVVLSYLKRLSHEDFKKVPDVTEGLESRFVNAIQEVTTLDELFAAVKTKRYAHSRIRRIVLNSFLSITKDDLYSPPSYIRVLAMNSTGKKILAKARKTAKIPIITKPSKGRDIPALRKSVFHADLYSVFSKTKQESEWKVSPCILDD